MSSGNQGVLGTTNDILRLAFGLLDLAVGLKFCVPGEFTDGNLNFPLDLLADANNAIFVHWKIPRSMISLADSSENSIGVVQSDVR